MILSFLSSENGAHIGLVEIMERHASIMITYIKAHFIHLLTRSICCMQNKHLHQDIYYYGTTTYLGVCVTSDIVLHHRYSMVAPILW